MSYAQARLLDIGPAMKADGAMPRERRKAPRTAMVFTLAKLTVDGRERPCMVRNLSTMGMQIQMPAPPPPGTVVLVEMHGMAAKAGLIRWVKDRVAGLRFDDPCDVADIFEVRQVSAGSPRFKIEQPGSLIVDGCAHALVVQDISVTGLSLCFPMPLPVGTPGVVELATGALSLAGTVGDRQDDCLQWHFGKPLSSITLAQALQSMRA